MIGLVLVTHGRLAQEFIAAMEHMVGPDADAAMTAMLALIEAKFGEE